MKKIIVFFTGFLLLLLGCPRSERTSMPKMYKVNFSSNPVEGGHIIAVTKDGREFKSGSKVAENTVLIFKAEAKKDYAISKWIGEGLNISADKKTAELTVKKNVEIKVFFKKVDTQVSNKYTVNFSAEPNVGGSIDAVFKNSGSKFTSGTAIEENTVLIFKAEAKKDYAISKWIGEGLNISADKKTAELTVKKNVEIKVFFKKVDTPASNKYTVNFSAEPNVGGSIDAVFKNSGSKFTSGTAVEENTVLIFKAEPSSLKYLISEWIGDSLMISHDKKTAELTVIKNTEVKVKFIHAPEYTVNFSSEPANGQGGTITAIIKDSGLEFKTGEKVPENTELLFTASPADGFYVEKWTGDGVLFSSDKKTASLTVKKETKVKVFFRKYIIEALDWEAEGQVEVYTADDKTELRNLKFAISDIGRVFTVFSGGDSYPCGMGDTVENNTFALIGNASGTIKFISTPMQLPASWEVSFKDVEITLGTKNKIKLKNGTVTLYVTFNTIIK